MARRPERARPRPLAGAVAPGKGAAADADAFNLIVETAVDGERATREREQAAQELCEARQIEAQRQATTLSAQQSRTDLDQLRERYCEPAATVPGLEFQA